MSYYSSTSRQEIAVLVIDQDTRVSQRISLLPDRDLVSYVDLLAALGQQLGPLLKSKKEHQQQHKPNSNRESSLDYRQSVDAEGEAAANDDDDDEDEDENTIRLPPEATNLLVFDKEIGTYVPLSDPPSTCIGDKSRLLIDFVPPSPARRRSSNNNRSASQTQQQMQQQLPNSRPGTSMGLNSSTNSDLPPTFPVSKNIQQYNQNDLPPRPESPASIFRRSAPTPTPPADHYHQLNTDSTIIPRQPSGSIVAVAVSPSSTTAATPQRVSSPIASLEPEMLLIEVSAKLLGDLAAAATSSSSLRHDGPSTSASLVSDSVERRLAKLPVIIQEKAVGAWSRAIAEGFEIAKQRRDSGEFPSPQSSLQATLDAVLADRDALLGSLRSSRSQIDELKQQLRIQEQAILLTNNNNNNFSRVDEQHQDDPFKNQKIVNEHQLEQIVRFRQDLHIERFMKQEAESRLMLTIAAFVTTPSPLSLFVSKPATNSVSTCVSADYERPSSRVGFATERERGETDPGRYLRDEIHDEVEDEDVDANDEEEKFKSRYAQQQPQHRDFTQRYKTNSQQQQQQAIHVSPSTSSYYYQVEVSPTNVSEKSDSLTPLPQTRTIASPVQEQQQQQQRQPPVPAPTTNAYEQERQATAPHNYLSGRSQSKDVFNGATSVAVFAHHQQQLPSARPLSATLRKIMEDTSADASKNRSQQAGSSSVFVSHIPPDDEDKSRPKQRRVGVVYSDPQLSHVPGGQRGTKSFLVPDPPTVEEVVFAAARALTVATAQIAVGYWAADGVTPVFIKDDEKLVKYLNDQPRIVPFVQCFVVGASYTTVAAAQKLQDASNNSYNSNQGFISGGGSGAVSGFRPSRPMSAPTSARPPAQLQQTQLHLPHNNNNNASSISNSNLPNSSSYYNHLESDFAPDAAAKISRPSSAFSTSSSSHRQHMWTGTNFARTADNSRRTDQTTVIKSEYAERGLEVLPPNPSEESKSSPWRLRLDGTPPPVHSAVASRLGGRSLVQQNNNTSASSIRGASINNNNNSHYVPDNIVDTSSQWEPLYRKQSAASNTSHNQLFNSSTNQSRPTSAQSRANTSDNNNNISNSGISNNNNNIAASSQIQHPASITWGGRGAAKSVQVFNSGVKEEEFDQLFQELCDEAGTDSQRQGVPPSVLLKYLDRNFDHMGDQRRFERLIGSYFCRSTLNRDELTLIMLKLAKE